MVDAALHFAARGWVCLSIEYRLTGDDPPAPPWIEVLGNPVLTAAHAAMVDTKRAVRWVRAHAGDYGCDINRVAGLGHSAGAYCIIQAAISDEADYANDAGAATPDQWAGYLGKLNAAVEVSGGCSNTLAEFDAGDAPLMIWHGDSDGTVSYTEAVTIDQECLAHQIPHRFYTLPGAGHGVATWLATYEGRDVKQHAEEFLNLFFSLRLGAAADGDVVRLSWPSVSNALYDVESSPALMTPFSSAIPAFRATDDTASVEAPLSAPACFYRVRIRSGQP
jgi:acetyl esterase/lipase